MNLWTMIVLIAAICVIGDIIKSGNINRSNISVESDENLKKLLVRLQNRIENLETIVLEEERNRRFAELD